jgi:DNA polymerase III delta prime subunit
MDNNASIQQFQKMNKLIINSWVEKYRPKELKDLLLEEGVKKYLTNILSNGIIENMTLYGHAGTGKSSIVSVIKNILDPITLYVDASTDTGVSNVREQIEPFCLSGRIDKSKLKLVVLNESNRLSQNSFDAMKDIIEKSSTYCKFIFITNDISPFPEPILSRCPSILIKPPLKEMVIHIARVLDKENVQYDKPSLAQIVRKLYPDIRKTINECYNIYVSYGSIKEEYINKNFNTYYDIFDSVFKNNTSIKDITDILKKSMYDESEIYSAMAKYFIEKYSKPSSAIIIIAEKIYQSKFIFDKDLNLLSTILMIKDLINTLN